MGELRSRGATLGLALAVLLALLPVGGAGAHPTPKAASGNVLALYQSAYITPQGTFTVSMQVADASNITFVYYNFCQLTSSVCYVPPITMTAQPNNWYVGTTKPMSQYLGMTVGVKAGYNITIDYSDNHNVSVPIVPNSFSNLTLVTSVTGWYEYEMVVSPQIYNLTGVVTNSSSGAALVGARVTVTPGTGLTTTTNSAGAYSFSGLVNGTYTVSVAAAGYKNSSTTATITGQAAVRNVRLVSTFYPAQAGGSGGAGPTNFFTTPLGIVSLSGIGVAAVAIVVVLVTLMRRANAARSEKSPEGEGPSEPGESDSK